MGSSESPGMERSDRWPKQQQTSSMATMTLQPKGSMTLVTHGSYTQLHGGSRSLINTVCQSPKVPSDPLIGQKIISNLSVPCPGKQLLPNVLDTLLSNSLHQLQPSSSQAFLQDCVDGVSTPRLASMLRREGEHPGLAGALVVQGGTGWTQFF